MNTERTEAGDQFVMPGCETDLGEKLSSLDRLISDAQRKWSAAQRMDDHAFADAMATEINRLRRIQDDLLDPAGNQVQEAFL